MAHFYIPVSSFVHHTTVRLSDIFENNRESISELSRSSAMPARTWRWYQNKALIERGWAHEE